MKTQKIYLYVFLSLYVGLSVQSNLLTGIISGGLNLVDKTLSNGITLAARTANSTIHNIGRELIEIFVENIGNILRWIFSCIRQFIIEAHLDPIRINGIEYIDNPFPGIPDFPKLDIYLRQGSLFGLSTIAYNNDSSVKEAFKNNSIFIPFNVNFDRLKIDFKYGIKMSRLGTKGRVTVDILQPDMNGELQINLSNFKLNLTELSFNNTRAIKLRFSEGFLLFDYIGNLFSNFIISLFKTKVINFLQEQLQSIINMLIEQVNLFERMKEVYDVTKNKQNQLIG